MMEKVELQNAITHFRAADMYIEEEYCLQKYKALYGEDEEYEKLLNYEKVLVIGIDCDKEVSDFIEAQTYKNLEYVSLPCNLDFFDRISEYLCQSSCQYVTFVEKNQKAKPEKIEYLLRVLRQNKDVSAAICTGNLTDEEGELIARPDFIITGSVKSRCAGLGNQIYAGKGLVNYCLTEEINALGTLSGILVRSEFVKQSIPLKENYLPILPTAILYSIILNCMVMIAPNPMMDIPAKVYNQEIVREKQRAFAEFVEENFAQELELTSTECKYIGLPSCYTDGYGIYSGNREPVRKMTFYYTDKGEYYNLQPLAKEAEKRGYEVIMTEDVTAASEIGFYSNHCADSKNAKFSVVLLHDMEQGHILHPNLWWWERWNKFDIGILPGPAWKERWETCAGFKYANTGKGVFAFGYPKSDYVQSEALWTRAGELKKALGLKYDKTILYAPSWENDGKEDDFICALQSMEVNLLIKQNLWPPQYGHITDNIQEQRKLHEGKYDNVYYVEPEESIMTALAMSDMVVSDESSVMTEGLMFGIPSLAVSDWLIPDTNPKRYASVPMNYVFKCKKAGIRQWVEKILSEEQYKEQAVKYCNEIYANIGNCCRDVLDCVEYYTAGAENDGFQRHRLRPKYMPSCLWY